MKKASVFLPFRLAGAAALAALFAVAHTAFGEPAKSLCTVSDYKILSATKALVQCGDVKDATGIAGKGGIIYEGTDVSKPVPANFTASYYVDNWLMLQFTSSSAPAAPVLKAGTKYTLAITLSSTAGGVTSSLPTSAPIDTSGSLTLVAPLIGGSDNYQVTSHLALQGLGLATGRSVACDLVLQDYNGTFARRPAMCKQLQVDMAGGAPGLPDPGTVGVLQLIPKGADDLAEQGIPYKVADLGNVLNAPMTFDAKSRLGSAKAPATKDACSYYINGSYAAGRGSKPAWILDGKVAPSVGRLIYGWQSYPTATANVGSNTISGMTYTDTIDFGLTEARPIRLAGALQEIYTSASAVYETDKEFDRDNLTGVVDFRYNFRNLYSPRAVETLRKFRDEEKTAKEHGITLQQGEVTPPLVGYALDFHTGVEAGAAIVDTTVKATTGKATITLPAYSIFRIVPQAHALLELGRLSIDAIGIPRYLIETENTVIQLPNNSLILKTVQGWKAYGVVTPSISCDRAGHFSLSASYKDGFAPPKFARINTVQFGVLIKY